MASSSSASKAWSNIRKPQFGRLNRRLGRPMRRHHDDSQLRLGPMHPAISSRPPAGQPEIGQDQMIDSSARAAALRRRVTKSTRSLRNEGTFAERCLSGIIFVSRIFALWRILFSLTPESGLWLPQQPAEREEQVLRGHSGQRR
jgi:hypothetical protein